MFGYIIKTGYMNLSRSDFMSTNPVSGFGVREVFLRMIPAANLLQRRTYNQCHESFQEKCQGQISGTF
jgi:hypothetical protein